MLIFLQMLVSKPLAKFYIVLEEIPKISHSVYFNPPAIHCRWKKNCFLKMVIDREIWWNKEKRSVGNDKLMLFKQYTSHFDTEYLLYFFIVQLLFVFCIKWDCVVRRVFINKIVSYYYLKKNVEMSFYGTVSEYHTEINAWCKI